MDTLAKIKATWQLPQNYLAYLEKHANKKDIESDLFVNWLRVYGHKSLLESQAGYSFNPITNEKLTEWPKDYVVIADDGADPYVLDLSQSDGVDAPVLYSMHGEGTWKFEKYADSFAEFKEKVGL